MLENQEIMGIFPDWLSLITLYWTVSWKGGHHSLLNPFMKGSDWSRYTLSQKSWNYVDFLQIFLQIKSFYIILDPLFVYYIAHSAPQTFRPQNVRYPSLFSIKLVPLKGLFTFGSFLKGLLYKVQISSGLPADY